MKYYYAYHVLGCQVCGRDFYDGDQFYLKINGQRSFGAKFQMYCEEHAPEGAELHTLQLYEPSIKR